MFETLGINLEKNVFHGLHRVLAPGMHQPDLLHTVDLGLFKQLMDWLLGFLKKHAWLQAFDDTWKALPAYPGFFVPKKAYREVTQWLGKVMRNVGRCLLTILAVALRQPDSRQVIPFKQALDGVLGTEVLKNKSPTTKMRPWQPTRNQRDNQMPSRQR